MGFTRTSEGRVFFKGADNDDLPRLVADSKPSKPAESVMSGDQTQMQILLLLKSLNTKLKASKEEQAAIKKQLATHKAALKDVRDKTGGYASNYIDLEQQISQKQAEAQKQVSRIEETLKDTLKQLEEARLLVEELENKSEGSTEKLEQLKAEVESRKLEEEKILKRQKELEKTQTAQSEKMVDSVAAYVALTKRVSESEARQAKLDNKIEDATSEYLKLDRKIEKALEDRNRILRKIERIETAVMETRDALNAKAMVFLAQQSAAMPPNDPTVPQFPQINDKASAKNDVQGNQDKNTIIDLDVVFQKLKQVSVGAYGAFAVLFVFVLLLGWGISSFYQSLGHEMPASRTALSSQGREIKGLKPEITRNLDTTLTSNEAEKDDPIIFNTPVIALDAPANKEKLIKELESEETRRAELMQENPAALGRELNAIEPFSPSQQKDDAAVVDPVPAVETRNIEAYEAELRDKITPDPDLDAMGKRIEAQAFDGNPEAQHDLGAIYVSGHKTIKQNVKRAVLWFTQAAENGVANAQYNLGVLYHQGLGVDKDIDRALKLYEMAARQGHPEAQYNLGIANIEGIGMPYNPQKAAIYFENAANKNVVEAAYNLGLIYENGLLGQTHPDEALMWYKRAADNGNAEAKTALTQLANSLGIALSDVNLVVEKTKNAKMKTKSLDDAQSQESITAAIQNELMVRGLYAGPVDGMNGPMTANAIKSYQTQARLTPDGIPSADLLSYMKAN